MLQENCSLAVIITLRVNPLPKALSERAKWPVLGGADALVGLAFIGADSETSVPRSLYMDGNEN